MAQILRIDGTVVPMPTDFDMADYNLTKSGRVASGKMTMEIISQKRKFFFTYEVLCGTELELIKSLVLNPTRPFFVLEYTENSGTVKSAIVYVGEIQRKKFRTDGPWYWKDVTFNLIEQ
jgi:hypothetical protein